MERILTLLHVLVFAFGISLLDAQTSQEPTNDDAIHLCQDQEFNFISPYLMFGQFGGGVLFDYKNPSLEELSIQHRTNLNSVVCRCDIRATRSNSVDKPFDVLIRWRDVSISENCKRSPNQCQDMFKIVFQGTPTGESSNYMVDNWSDTNAIRKEEHSADNVHTVRLEYIHYTDAMRSLLTSRLEVIGNRRMYVKCGVDIGQFADGSASGDPRQNRNSSVVSPVEFQSDVQRSEKYLLEIVIVIIIICMVILIASVTTCIIWKRRQTVTYFGAHWRGHEDDKSGTVGASSMVVEVGTLDNHPTPLLTKPKIGDDFTVNFDPKAQSSRDDLTEDTQYHQPSSSGLVHDALVSNPPVAESSQDSLLQVNEQMFIEAERNSSWTDSPELPPRLPPRRGSKHNSSFPGVSPIFLRPPPPSPRKKHYSWHYNSNGAHSNDSDSDDHLRRLLRPQRHVAGLRSRNHDDPNQPLVHQSRHKRPATKSPSLDVKLPVRAKFPKEGGIPPQDCIRLEPVGAESGCESGSESDSSENSLLSDRFPSSEHHVLDTDDDAVHPCDSISNHNKDAKSHETEEEYLDIWRE